MGSTSHTVSKDKFQINWKFKCATEVIKELRENMGEFLYMLRVGIDISKYNSNRIQNNKLGHVINKTNPSNWQNKTYPIRKNRKQPGEK